MKKGVEGQFILPISLLDKVKNNINNFNSRMDASLNAHYQICEAEVNDEEVILIEFNIMNNTSKQVKADLSYFKSAIKELFGKTPENHFTVFYDKM